MTDSTKPSAPKSRLCETCQINPVIPYQIDSKWIYPLICPSCRQREWQEWIRRTNEEKEKCLQVQNQRRAAEIIPQYFRSASVESLPEEMQKEIEDLPANKGLCLFGPVGCGKTYTLAAIARKRIESNVWPVEFENWERLLCRLRSYYGGKAGQAERHMEQMMKAKAVFLDDLSIAGSESDFALKTLYTILDYRIENHLPTFFSSNRTPDQIGQAYDQRIVSRIKGHCKIIRYEGHDRRIQQVHPVKYQEES